MRSGTMAFAAGILALQGCKELPDLFWLSFLLPACLPGLVLRGFVYKITTGFLLGFAWAWLSAAWLLEQALPATLEGEDLVIVGHIADIPVDKGRLWQFDFDVEASWWDGRAVVLPRHIRLSWYGQPAAELKAGDRWRLTVRLKRPHGLMNPGGFDYEQWLFSHRLLATGYVRKGGPARLLRSDSWDYPLQRLRQRLLGQITAALPAHPVQGIVAALTLGQREGIDPSQWEAFRLTGTSHLVAISGLHIGLVAGLVFLLIRRLWVWCGPLPLYLAAPRAAALGALLAAGLYAALAGWSIPTQRALIMVAVAMLAVMLRRHLKPSHGLSLALLLVLLHDPFAVLSPGFWLSFGAVALLMVGMQGRGQGQYRWVVWLKPQWLVGLGLSPLLLFFFQQASLVSPLANVLAIPVVSLAVVPMLLSGLLLSGLSASLGQTLLAWGADLMALLTDALQAMGQWPSAAWAGAAPGPIVLGLALCGVALLLFTPRVSARWLGVVCLLPLLFAEPPRPRHGEVYFYLLDVGQGLSAVIQTQAHTLVFDTGPRFSERTDGGAMALLPFLQQQGVRGVDRLIVSHGDTDHSGGLDSLLRGMAVKAVYSSDTNLIATGRAQACAAGQHWEWEGVVFRLLFPDTDSAQGKANDRSCVLHVQGAYGAVLLPGDIEKATERHLVATQTSALKADILVAPHHGSNTSSTAEFIQAVQARYVLFAVGYRNRHRFPSQKVLARYRLAHTTPYDTAAQGMISFRLAANPVTLRPELYRPAHQRYWHHKDKD